MRKRLKKSAAAGKDLISDLPDEILHSIIRRISCSKAAEQTIGLSSRWRNLWRSYPVVQLNPNTRHEFYSIGSEGFQKFHDATMKRFNQDKLLQMEALKLSIQIDDDDLCSPDDDDCSSPAVEQLLELASERKAEYIEIGRLFTNLIASSPLLETLKLESVTGMEKLWVSDVAKLKTLRFLHLKTVEFDKQLLADLIASSPLLETLKLEYIFGMRKLVVCNAANLKKLEISACYFVDEIQIAASGLRDLHIENSYRVLSIGLIAPQLNVLKLDNLTLDDEQVFLDLIAANPLLETLQLININNLKKLQLSNLPNLKTLVITDCIDVEEIQIAAYELHSLHLERKKSKRMLHKIELIAPQLNDLKIINHGLRMVDLKEIVCKLQYLKSLNLVGIAGFGQRKSWKLKFAGRKLKEFILWWVSKGLKKNELDADAKIHLC
ncbi:F-box protein At5g03100 [Linum perenne]